MMKGQHPSTDASYSSSLNGVPGLRASFPVDGLSRAGGMEEAFEERLDDDDDDDEGKLT